MFLFFFFFFKDFLLQIVAHCKQSSPAHHDQLLVNGPTDKQRVHKYFAQCKSLPVYLVVTIVLQSAAVHGCQCISV